MRSDYSLTPVGVAWYNSVGATSYAHSPVAASPTATTPPPLPSPSGGSRAHGGGASGSINAATVAALTLVDEDTLVLLELLRAGALNGAPLTTVVGAPEVPTTRTLARIQGDAMAGVPRPPPPYTHAHATTRSPCDGGGARLRSRRGARGSMQWTDRIDCWRACFRWRACSSRSVAYIVFRRGAV